MNAPILNEAHSYATRANAEKALAKVVATLDEDLQTLHHFIIAQPDGRFSPCVYLDARSEVSMHYLIGKNICVIRG